MQVQWFKSKKHLSVSNNQLPLLQERHIHLWSVHSKSWIPISQHELSLLMKWQILSRELHKDIYNFNLISDQETSLWCINLDII